MDLQKDEDFEKAWQENRHIWESTKNLAKAMFYAGQAKSQADQKIKLLLCDEHLKKCESPTGVFNSQYPDEEPCLICLVKEAKAQADPDGFVLNKPAKVGSGTFGIGVKWSIVIGAAQRQFEYTQNDVGEKANIQNLKGILFDVPEGFVLVPREPNREFKDRLRSYLDNLWMGEWGCDWDGFVSVNGIDPNEIWQFMIKAQEQAND